MRKIVVLLLIGAGAMAGCSSPLREIRKAKNHNNIPALSKMLAKGKYGYIRERAARAMRHANAPVAARATAIPVLEKCLQNAHEYRYVRAECALTLGTWRVPKAVPGIMDAIDAVGDQETRYWLLVALTRFNHLGPKACGLIDSLKKSASSSLYVSTLVEQWEHGAGEKECKL